MTQERDVETPIHIAVTGVKHFFGTEFMKVGLILHFVKEPDNPHDQEAIKAIIPPVGQVGYVANSPHTVPKGCRSAGRIYDLFEEQISGIVRFILKDMLIVELVHHIKQEYILDLDEMKKVINE